jgi:hypothetical protein
MDLHRRAFAALTLSTAAGLSSAGTARPAPWNDGLAKKAILKFVRATDRSVGPGVCAAQGAHCRVRPGRYALCRPPGLHQVVYCLEHIGALVKEKPELRELEPVEAVPSGGPDAVAELSMREIFEIVLET